jgi:putative chitinase
MVGCWYWNKRKINALADANDSVAVTRAINGGTNGLAERQKLLSLCQFVFGG